MQEHNCARPDRGQHCADNRIDTGARPVTRVYPPVKSRQTRLCHFSDHFVRPYSVRGTHMPNCGLGTCHPDDPVRVQYFASYFIRFASRQIRMSRRAIGNLVSLGDHSLDQLRLVLYVRADDAERCWHPVFCQRLEDVRCAKWIRTVVKRQVDIATSGAIVALVAHLGYGIEDLHRSGPFRSIIEPVSRSTVDRPIR
ncbi:hypothetical protein OKW46_006530 [Paraburkholderia sp. WSM4179]|nr:hypothetical protein [Paraburkholderia sp. WSM4179]